MNSESPANLQKPEPIRRKYSAFISYRHADNRAEGRRWADWLHEQLESFEVSPKLAGRLDRDGVTVPATLFPVFRDEKELAADASLDRAIHDALDASDALILIASPRAAASPHVNDEVAYFAKLGRANRIITVVIDGIPDGTRKPGTVREAECLPPALLGLLSKDGGESVQVEGDEERRSGPLWVDLRVPGIDGAPPEEGWTSTGSYLDHLTRVKGVRGDRARRLAREYGATLRENRLRIIAGALNVPYGALRRETNEFAVRRLRRLLLVSGATVAVLLGLAWIANQQRLEALHANRTANGMINEMLYDLGDKLVPLGRLELLDEVSKDAEEYFAGLSVEARYRDAALGYARALIKRGEVFKAGAVSKGKAAAKAANADALARYEQALHLLEKVKKQTPEIRLEAALACERVADMLEDKENERAIETTRRGIAIVEELEAGGGPIVGTPLLRLKGQLYERLGDLLEDNVRNLAAAEEAFRTSYEVRKALHGGEPGNGFFTRDYAVSLARLGDVYLADGRWEMARTDYAEGLEVRRELVRGQGLNAAWQSELSRSNFSLADAEVRLGKLADARAHLDDALRIRQLLADFDPPNDRWQGDVIRTLAALGDVDWMEWKQQPGQGGGKLLGQALDRLGKAEAACSALDREKRWADKLMLEAAGVQVRLALVHVFRQQAEPALAACTSARGYLENAIRARKGNPDDKLRVMRARLDQVEAATAKLRGDGAAAEKVLRKACAEWKDLAEGDTRQYEVRQDWAICCDQLARLLRKLRPDAPDAETYAAEARQITEDLKSRGRLDFRGRLFLGVVDGGE